MLKLIPHAVQVNGFWQMHFCFVFTIKVSCLSSHVLMNIHGCSNLGWLWVKLTWTFTFRFWCGHQFSDELGKCLVMWLLDCMTRLCLVS